jgi:hypothetical protein
LLVAACVVPSSSIFVTLMKEAPGSSETSVLARATRRNNPEDTILQVLFYLPLQKNSFALTKLAKLTSEWIQNNFHRYFSNPDIMSLKLTWQNNALAFKFNLLSSIVYSVSCPHF